MPSRPIKHIKPILLVFVLLLVACGQQNRQVQTTDTVVDDYDARLWFQHSRNGW